MDIMEEMTAIDIGEVSVIDRSSVAGSLDRLAEYLAAIPPGKLAIIAGDEISASNAAAETVLLAEALAAPVFGSSWPAHIPFPTSHPLWIGNLPTRANEIAQNLKAYDAIFALGGKSLITILYTEGSAVPNGIEVFQLSADARDLGRTYPTKLSVVGDIRASLTVLLSHLAPKIASRAEAYTALRKHAARDQEARRARLMAAADAEFTGPVTTPLVAGREMARAIGPNIAIVDEAPATLGHLRAFLNTSSTHQYSFSRGGALGWGMPAAVGFSLGIDRAPVVSIVGDGAALYSPQALWTAAHEKLPVTFVVVNNREYNILKKYMASQPQSASVRANRFIAMDIVDPAIDFLALAASMGVPARRVERAADIAPAIEAGIASGVPNLIEIPIAAS
jgi:benzoylformate decarboxylase